MARSALRATCAYFDLLHFEADLAESLCKVQVSGRRPDSQHAAWTESHPGGRQPLRVVQSLIGRARESLRTIVDVQRNGIECPRTGNDHIADVRNTNAYSTVLKAVTEQACERTSRPGQH